MLRLMISLKKRVGNRDDSGGIWSKDKHENIGWRVAMKRGNEMDDNSDFEWQLSLFTKASIRNILGLQ